MCAEHVMLLSNIMATRIWSCVMVSFCLLTVVGAVIALMHLWDTDYVIRRSLCYAMMPAGLSRDSQLDSEGEPSLA